MRARGLPAALLAALLVPACAGPRAPLEVGVKEIATDLLLGGAPAAPPPPAAPSLPLAVALAPAPPPQPAPFSPPPAAPAPPCPEADPLSSPRLAAPNRAQRPPAEAVYTFRNRGSFEVGGVRAPLPSSTTRRVRNVRQVEGGFAFEVVEEAPGVATTTAFQLVPASTVPGGAGLFLTRQQVRLATGATDTFVPLPPLKFLEFPLEPGRTWDAVGTDPATATTMALRGRVGIEVPDGDDPDTNPDLVAKGRVDACGRFLDAWLVSVLGPGGQGGARIVGPGKDLTLTATYAFATQFGALSVSEVVDQQGTVGGSSFRLHSEATISSEPLPPA